MASPVPSRGVGSPPSTSRQPFVWCHTGHHWPSLLQGHTAGWCSTWCPPGPTGPFLTSSLPAGCIPQYMLVHGTLHSPLWVSQGSISPTCWGASGASAIPPRFVTLVNLLGTHCDPSSRSCNTSQDAKQERSQHWPLGFTARCWAPNRFHAAVTALWDQLFTQFSVHLTTCYFRPHFTIFSTRIIWRQCQKPCSSLCGKYPLFSAHVLGQSFHHGRFIQKAKMRLVWQDLWSDLKVQHCWKWKLTSKQKN